MERWFFVGMDRLERFDNARHVGSIAEHLDALLLYLRGITNGAIRWITTLAGKKSPDTAIRKAAIRVVPHDACAGISERFAKRICVLERN